MTQFLNRTAAPESTLERTTEANLTRAVAALRRIVLIRDGELVKRPRRREAETGQTVRLAR